MTVENKDYIKIIEVKNHKPYFNLKNKRSETEQIELKDLTGLDLEKILLSIYDGNFYDNDLEFISKQFEPRKKGYVPKEDDILNDVELEVLKNIVYQIKDFINQIDDIKMEIKMEFPYLDEGN